MTTHEKKRDPDQTAAERYLQESRDRQNRIDQLKDEATETRMRLVGKLLAAGEKLMPKAIEQAGKGKPALLRIIARNTRMIR